MKKKIKKLIECIKNYPQNVDYKKLCKICDYLFGKPRQKRDSHRIYKTPWTGNPRINIQNKKGKAKVYQVKHAIKAIERLEVEDEIKK